MPLIRGQVLENTAKRRPEAADQLNRERTTKQVLALADQLLLPEDAYSQQKLTGDNVVLLAGDRESLLIKQAGTRVVGQPGARITQNILVQTADVLIEGVTFDGAVELSQDLTGVRFSRCRFNKTLTISAGSTVVFDHCWFSKTVGIPATGSATINNSVMQGLWNITNGGRTHHIGCTFAGTSAVNNAGAALNCFIVGCVRKSGVGHAAVTVICETT